MTRNPVLSRPISSDRAQIHSISPGIRHVATWTLLGLLLLLLFSSASFAQSIASGTVIGMITDQSDAVVPDAKITMTNKDTGNTLTTTSNASGHYTFANVSPGMYDIKVTKEGFASIIVANQAVRVGTSLTENLKMQVGTVTQEVDVQTTGTELQTLNATVGNAVSGIALQSLPSLGRDVSTFVTLQPGISPDGSVAGTVVDQSSFMLDGGNNTNDMDGSMSVYTPSFSGDPTGGVSNQSNGVAAGPTGVMPTPADSVEEFKVNTANQTADFNSSSGAQVQVVTKRGTNSYHGTVYEYYLDNNFSANTWENNFNNHKQPDYHYNRFGAAFGGPITKKNFLGGQTFFFANYQGFRWPNSETINKVVPTASMRLGLLYFGGQYYNLNPTPVTFNGTVYPSSGLDPRNIGIDPLVSQLWNKYMPLPNSGCALSRCDTPDPAGPGNIGNFTGNVGIPQNDNFGVFRLDHDFGSKWHLMSSYRYYKLTRATHDQVDIGGLVSGDTLGVPKALSSRPQQPWYLVAGLTTNVTNNITNDFHVSYLRNFWSWQTAGDPPQFSGIGGAIEPLGESRDQSLSPYNVNTQQTRTRFWDGHDWMFRDDVSLMKGNHLLNFGGTYQRNWNYHQRTDNGGGINYQTVYQLSTASGVGGIISIPAAPPGASSSNWGRDYTAVLGMVGISQIAYTRTGANLALNPPLTPASDQSTIPYYNVYVSDTWKIKPTFTLTYGLGWTLEMPPTEKDGKQIELVDASNQPISAEQYLKSREMAALQGQVFNPQVGFALLGNTAGGQLKYPYNPFYGSFSPRVAAAWNPQFDDGTILGHVFGHDSTVIRGGYGRIYGRLNGVDLVLVPLLGTGLIQPVQCIGATMTGGCGGATAANAFRVGTDGGTAPLPAALPTLPQPLYPGINGVAAGAGEALDPNFRPNVVDSFDFTVQRQLNRKLTLEMGYIGRHITHEYMPLNINAVPYMMTLGGQRFDKAYAAMVLQYCGGMSGLAGGGCTGNLGAVTPQPFFEAALNPAYCAGYASCTAAVADKEGVGAAGTGNIPIANVWSLWSDLDNGNFNFPRTMMNTPLAGTAPCPGSTDPTPCGANGQLTSGVGVNASVGYGNYNAAFVSLKMVDWNGLTMQSNFTWAKALGTGAEVQATSEATAPDPYNLQLGYGYQPFDRKFVYNLFFVYQPKFYKSQQGFVGHLLGGWTLAPIFAAGSGLPITFGTANGGGQAFGEGDSSNFFGYGVSENAIPIGPMPSVGVHYLSTGGKPNLFADPVAAWNNVRQPLLGYDTRDGGFGPIHGLGYWNVDLSIKKQIKLTERFGFEAQMVVTNLFNHVVFQDPGPGDYLDTSASPSTWSVLPAQGNTPRTMEFGIRLNF